MNLAQTKFRSLMASYRSMHRAPAYAMVLDRLGVTMDMAVAHPLAGTGTPKECYTNSARIAIANGNEYTYCEGIACSPSLGVPIDHAWLLDKSGKVVDPTWTHTDAVYYGVPFTMADVIDYAAASGVYGILTSTYIWGRDISIARVRSELVQAAHRGLAHVGLSDTERPFVGIEVWTPGPSEGIRNLIERCFIFDSLTVTEGATGLRCTVTGHDAEYVEEALLECLTSKHPPAFVL